MDEPYNRVKKYNRPMKRLKKIAAIVSLVFAISISVSYKSDFFEIAKQIEIYTTLFKELNLYYIDEINPAEIMDRAIQRTLNDLDPYTRFYDEQGVENARITAEGEYGGIGATISFKDGNLIVREIYKDYPAHKSGLLVGDEIVKIGNTVLKEHEESYVRSLLKGLPNTIVELELKRHGIIKQFSVKRETVEISPVPFYTMINEEVGYISFTKFNRKASKEVKSAFLDLKSQGMKQLIIDVRHNPGGLLGEAVNIVNFFIPKNKVVVTTQAKLDKWSSSYKTKYAPLDLEIPLSIIVDNRSASASEILAGALQDYDRAVIIGQRSFGKGLVQRSRKLSYGTQLKLTISKYYTPSGRCIQELDYTNRNLETGEIPKFSDGDVQAFKTSNGRPVYDGGGVLPDKLIEKITISGATKKLLNSDLMFNYVSDYYSDHQTIEPADLFKLSSKEYTYFKDFAIEHADDFKVESELILEKNKELITQDNSKLNNDFDQFLKSIGKEKLAAIDADETVILDALEEKIISSYYFKEGLYKHKVSFDKEIEEAVKTLQDSVLYRAILN